MDGYPILLQTRDRDVERAVNQAVADSTAASSVGVCRDHEALAARLGTDPAPVVLVDVDGDERTALGRLETLSLRHTATRFVVICRRLESELLLAAMQAGARNCLARSGLALELPALLDRFGRDVVLAPASGRMVTVLSARGGCGGTTIAVNLAAELHLASGHTTLLLDMDAHYGAVAAYLGVEGQFGLGDVLAADGVIDGQLVSSTASVFNEGLHVLLSPASVNFAEPASFRFDRLEPVLSACRRAYHDVVIDAPRVPMDVAADLAEASALTLIVFELTVIDVRTTRRMVQALLDRQAEPGRILAVANRCRKRVPTLTLDDARDALEGTEVYPVSNDFAGAVKAMNLGRPLHEVAPRSALRQDLCRLVDRLPEPSSPSTPQPS